MQKLRVFISSTMEDMQEERNAVANAIDRYFFWESVYAESFVARSKSPREVCLEEVRRSHIYVGIYKNRYGYIPSENNPKRRSVTVLEYYEAKKNELPILIFVSKNAGDIEKELHEFLAQLTDFDEGHWNKKYSTIEDLVESVLNAISYEVTRGYIEMINYKRKQHIKEIYELPYFKMLKERFMND